MSERAGAAALQRRGMIVRRRLLDALDAPDAAPLTVVTGPAGAGKTVLLETWAAEQPAERIAFAALDPAASSVDGLWARLAPALGDDSDTPASADELADRILVLAAGGRRRPRTLVIDDLHLAESDSTRRVLSRLLAQRSGPRVVLSSRVDPGLALHRMRLAGELSEIRSDDLAFTIDEAGEMLARQKIALSSAALALLWERTEGWAAGLRLAALSLAGHEEPEAFVADFAGDDRAVVAYLIDEVFARQPQRARELLLATAVVERISVPLANALTGRDDAAQVLDELVAANALVIALDRRGDWFRYHALLADLLRAQLARRGPDAVARQHRLAAQWYLAGDDTRAALRHSVHARDWDRVTQIVADHWLALRIDDGPLLDAALRAFPHGQLEARPYAALVAAARCLDRGQLSEADVHLRTAMAGRARLAGLRRGRFVGDLALVRLRRATIDGDVAAARRQAAVLDAAGDDEPARRRRVRALAELERGRIGTAAGDDEDAAMHLALAAALARADGDTELAAQADGERAWLHALDGELGAARRVARSAIARAAQSTGGCAAALLAQALAAAEIGDVQGADESLESARAAIAGAPGAGGRRRTLEVEFVAARLAMLGPRTGLPEAAQRVRAALREFVAAPPPPRLGDLARAQLARLLVHAGRPDEALAEAAPAPDRADGGAIAVARAGALLALGRSEEALAQTRAAAGSALPWTVAAAAVASAAAEAEGDRGQAQRLAEHALDLAEPEGARLGLAVALDGLEPVLRRLLRVGTAHRSLIAEVLELGHWSATASDSGVEPLREPLSARELTVLRYLPTLLSSTEIAGELFVTVNTVKSHLKSIYRKLDASSRREAVQRARDLGLIAPTGLSGARRES
jgi:LuxR family transcriptional regulator, maltose regulon positive regulatory protein